jgi:predicted NUDIX family NTP pyrophosphohydrolase
MPKRSAGLLMYRLSGGHLEVLLGHPGGPLWMKKDLGAWTANMQPVKSRSPPRPGNFKRKSCDKKGKAWAAGRHD